MSHKDAAPFVFGKIVSALPKHLQGSRDFADVIVLREDLVQHRIAVAVAAETERCLSIVSTWAEGESQRVNEICDEIQEQIRSGK